MAVNNLLSTSIILGGITLGLLSMGVTAAPNAAKEKVSADNSAINERDARPTELTAEQQGSAKSDVEITRQIRKELMKHTELSTYAHNIKIITKDGLVTLKGPVKSAEESATILEIAGRVCDPQHVRNEMQVASSK